MQIKMSETVARTLTYGIGFIALALVGNGIYWLIRQEGLLHSLIIIAIIMAIDFSWRKIKKKYNIHDPHNFYVMLYMFAVILTVCLIVMLVSAIFNYFV